MTLMHLLKSERDNVAVAVSAGTHHHHHCCCCCCWWWCSSCGVVYRCCCSCYLFLLLLLLLLHLLLFVVQRHCYHHSHSGFSFSSILFLFNSLLFSFAASCPCLCSLLLRIMRCLGCMHGIHQCCCALRPRHELPGEGNCFAKAQPTKLTKSHNISNLNTTTQAHTALTAPFNALRCA